jgi:hypothetical protein
MMANDAKKQLSAIIGPMAKGKSQMETAAGYVKERYKINSKQYDETQKRYNKAKGDYDGWLAELKFNIREGLEIKSLQEKYKPISEKIDDFVKYTNSQVSPITKAVAVAAILAVIPTVIDIAQKLWNLYKKADEDGKEKIIKEIDAQAWKEFKAI